MIRVLLVDDQELFRSGVAVSVGSAEDIEVVAQAGDGAEALRLADEVQPDVVLMDVQMPVMDGVEATRRLLAPAAVATRERPLRVVVLTTFALDDRAAAAIRYGASAFLLKDATPDFLRATIRIVHGGGRVLAADDLTPLFAVDRPDPAAMPEAYARLTDKEREILASVARGASNAEVAAAVHLSESTVKTHVGSILRKLGLRDRVQVVVFAHRHGLVPPD